MFASSAHFLLFRLLTYCVSPCVLGMRRSLRTKRQTAKHAEGFYADDSDDSDLAVLDYTDSSEESDTDSEEEYDTSATPLDRLVRLKIVDIT